MCHLWLQILLLIDICSDLDYKIIYLLIIIFYKINFCGSLIFPARIRKSMVTLKKKAILKRSSLLGYILYYSNPGKYLVK